MYSWSSLFFSFFALFLRGRLPLWLEGAQSLQLWRMTTDTCSLSEASDFGYHTLFFSMIFSGIYAVQRISTIPEG
jgi:hypothetical protein